MTHLSSQPYKGARDTYPEDQRVVSYIFAAWRRVCERHGYEEYGAPLLEPLEVYAAKTGQEIVNEQTYTFTDRGGRQVAIRPEMTPSVSRMIAARRQEIAYPARWYSIANFMRYERPQRGREREFWQLNADIFGVEGIAADAEIITMAYRLTRELGATRKMFTIRINNRDIINFVMASYLGLDVVQAHLMIKLFDRKDKMSYEDFESDARDIFGTETADQGLKKIKALVGAATMADLPRELLDHPVMQEVQQLFARLAAAGVDNAIFDISLMRGFDYYTGMVFEVFDNHPDNRRAMFGGGRYDGLVGLFGVEPIATVGFAPGLTTTINFLESHQLVPDLRPATDIYMVVLGDAQVGADKLADRLREEGINVAVDISGRKLDKQIKSAIKMGVGYLLFVGEDELKSETYTLKDIREVTEQKLSLERVISTVFDYRRAGRRAPEQPDDDLVID